MLQQAEDKDVYTSLEHFKLGGPEYIDNFPQQLKNKGFDFVTAGDLIDTQMPDENIFE
jgi:predicted TPR repeat methyltransferase